jgi:hypothetical protein
LAPGSWTGCTIDFTDWLYTHAGFCAAGQLHTETSVSQLAVLSGRTVPYGRAANLGCARPIFFVTRGSQAYATPATRQPEKRKTRRVAHADNSKIFIFVCTPQLLSRSCSELGLNFVSEKCPFSELGPKFVSGHRSLCTKISRNVHESSRSRAFFTCISLYSFVYVQVLRSSNSTPPQADPFGVQRAVLPSQSRTQH